MANCDGCGSPWGAKRTALVCGSQEDNRQAALGACSFPANRFGLYDMVGNVWEWTEDCWNESYQGAPAVGSAWTNGDCSRRVVRGGSWNTIPDYLRSAARYRVNSGDRNDLLGFRVARTLSP